MTVIVSTLARSSGDNRAVIGGGLNPICVTNLRGSTMAKTKGLWIPIDILSRADLQMYDKIPLALVAYLDSYGGLSIDHLDTWAAQMGCDRRWLEHELQRLARRYLIHRDGLAWRMGPPKTDPRQTLPELPDGAEPLMINNGIAVVMDDEANAVRMYRTRDNNVPHNQR